MLSKTQIASLNRARVTLGQIQARLTEMDASKFGRLEEASEAAENAILNVLIVAKVYSITDVTDAELHPGGGL